MTTRDSTSITLPAAVAMQQRDPAAATRGFAPGARLHSPLTDRLVFSGHEQIAAVLTVLLESFEDLRYVEEVRAPGVVVLRARARVGGRPIEILDHCDVDDEDRITEMTVFFRPLPATAAALRAFGSGLARRQSRARGALVSGLTLPLVGMTGAGDGVGVRLVGTPR